MGDECAVIPDSAGGGVGGSSSSARGGELLRMSK